jgi:hypothetical protein
MKSNPSTLTATLIKTDGTRKPMAPANGKHFDLKELQQAVGGYIEIRYWGEMVAVMNEDGKMQGLPVNPTATLLGRGFLHNGDEVVGDIVLTPAELMD